MTTPSLPVFHNLVRLVKRRRKFFVNFFKHLCSMIVPLVKSDVKQIWSKIKWMLKFYFHYFYVSLQSTLDERLSHVSCLRNSYPTFNFYTTDQLVSYQLSLLSSSTQICQSLLKPPFCSTWLDQICLSSRTKNWSTLPKVQWLKNRRRRMVSWTLMKLWVTRTCLSMTIQMIRMNQMIHFKSSNLTAHTKNFWKITNNI